VARIGSFIDLPDIRDLLDRHPTTGILTIYLDPESGYRHEAQRWQTQLNSGLKALSQRYPDDKHLRRAIEAAETEIPALPPEYRHRSLVYMRALDPDWQWIRSLHGTTGTRFGWAPRPMVLPLLGFLHRHPVAGVILGSQEGLQGFTWRQGLLEPAGQWPLAVDTEDWRRFLGRAAPHLPQQRATHTDAFAARFVEQLKRELAARAPAIHETAQREGWQHLMVFGPTELREHVLAALPAPWPERSIPVPDRHLARAGTREVAEAAEAALSAWLDQQDAAAVEALIAAALGRGKASIGVQEILDLLAEERVARLYVCSDLELTGYRLPDGRLRLNLAPGQEQGSAELPDLAEAVAARALRLGVEVVPLVGSAAHLLRPHGGMGAELRY